MILRVGKPNPRALLLGLVCRVRGHRPDVERIHRLRVSGHTTHRYLVTRCIRCTRVLTAERIGRKKGAVRRIDVRKEKP